MRHRSPRILLSIPTRFLQEHHWISQVLKTSLYTCHGLITPLTRRTLVITVALHGLRRRYKPRQSGFIIGAIPTLQVHAFPMAYIILCLRFTLFVRLIASSRRKVFLTSDSAQRARLDTGGRLNLTRLGLSPSKMLQASLVALTPKSAIAVAVAWLEDCTQFNP